MATRPCFFIYMAVCGAFCLSCQFAAAAEADPNYVLSVDLENQTVTEPDGKTHSFEIDAFRKRCLLEGLDDIGLTLQHEDKVAAYEAAHPLS